MLSKRKFLDALGKTEAVRWIAMPPESTAVVECRSLEWRIETKGIKAVRRRPTLCSSTATENVRGYR